MRTFLLQRLLIVLPLTLLGGVTIVFFLIHLVPGDPVAMTLDEYATQDTYEDMERRLGLDKPLHIQYVEYLRSLLRLDLGTSFQNRRPVIVNLAEQFPFTGRLAVASLTIAILIALPTGILSAVYRNRWPDYVSMSLALLAVCSPLFVTGIALLLLFSLKLGWLPTFGVGKAGNLRSVLAHLALPALAQGARSAALLARVTRSTVLETMGEDYIRTARAKGLREQMVVLRHGLPNALIPIITLIGMNMASLLGGTVIIETVFSRQGVGRVLIKAVLARDYPQIQGTLLIFILITVLANTIVDLLYGWVDPRISYS
jgi:ABC-type dipeptide/oligopeptide/nickel transport system permease component